MPARKNDQPVRLHDALNSVDNLLVSLENLPDNRKIEETWRVQQKKEIRNVRRAAESVFKETRGSSEVNRLSSALVAYVKAKRTFIKEHCDHCAGIGTRYYGRASRGNDETLFSLLRLLTRNPDLIFDGTLIRELVRKRDAAGRNLQLDKTLIHDTDGNVIGAPEWDEFKRADGVGDSFITMVLKVMRMVDRKSGTTKNRHPRLAAGQTVLEYVDWLEGRRRENDSLIDEVDDEITEIRKDDRKADVSELQQERRALKKESRILGKFSLQMKEVLTTAELIYRERFLGESGLRKKSFKTVSGGDYPYVSWSLLWGKGGRGRRKENGQGWEWWEDGRGWVPEGVSFYLGIDHSNSLELTTEPESASATRDSPDYFLEIREPMLKACRERVSEARERIERGEDRSEVLKDLKCHSDFDGIIYPHLTLKQCELLLLQQELPGRGRVAGKTETHATVEDLLKNMIDPPVDKSAVSHLRKETFRKIQTWSIYRRYLDLCEIRIDSMKVRLRRGEILDEVVSTENWKTKWDGIEWPQLPISECEALHVEWQNRQQQFEMEERRSKQHADAEHREDNENKPAPAKAEISFGAIDKRSFEERLDTARKSLADWIRGVLDDMAVAEEIYNEVHKRVELVESMYRRIYLQVNRDREKVTRRNPVTAFEEDGEADVKRAVEAEIQKFLKEKEDPNSRWEGVPFLESNLLYVDWNYSNLPDHAKREKLLVATADEKSLQSLREEALQHHREWFERMKSQKRSVKNTKE